MVNKGQGQDETEEKTDTVLLDGNKNPLDEHDGEFNEENDERDGMTPFSHAYF